MIGLFTRDGALVGVFKNEHDVDAWVESHTIDGKRLERLEASILAFEKENPRHIGQYRAQEVMYTEPIAMNDIIAKWKYAMHVYDKAS